MSSRLFGTDGVRGLANGELTASLATSLGISAAQVLGEQAKLSATTNERLFAIVGRDPRVSGEFLQAAVSAGLASAGVDVVDVGVVPTPAVAYLTDVTGADLGVMISASHNAMPDNGIKFFARGGHKLADSIEDDIASHLDNPGELPTGAAVGRIRANHDLVEKYLDHVLSSITADLSGLTIVVDCANGAASVIAPEIYRRAGARVVAIHSEPTGYNINENCGSTHMDDLKKAVLAHNADLGIAHDGDADRCLAVDAAGELVDGDQILAILANGRKQRDELVGDTVVVTVMSNLGFTLAMREREIDIIASAVGDRYVLDAMRERGLTLGGEQSGHVILADFATTGDGLLTALHIMAEMKHSGKSLAELAGIVTRLPQVLINVKNVDRTATNAPALQEAIAEIENQLGDTGRVLLRPSGTEPLIRVMVEAATHEQAEQTAQFLATVVQEHCAIS
ncbi:MAG: phosphoglucosamine mutase [Actinobacteria bacterium]|nr:phosphoglucosamine mutase [Actinomycetota bacterium]NBY15119.1 phosphoglucosamine mutase [Actinomycetota bacterium]